MASLPEDEDDSCQRGRIMTDKGRDYTLQIRKKERAARAKSLLALSVNIHNLTGESTVQPSAISKEYAKWQQEYDEFLVINDTCETLCSHDEKEEDKRNFHLQNNQLLTFKDYIQGWIVEHSAVRTVLPPVDRFDSVSRISKCSSISSQISVEKLKESQRKAELTTRATAMKEKHAIEETKLKLKLREETLDIKTEIEVSDARNKVLEDLEKSIQQDNEMEELLARRGETLHVRVVDDIKQEEQDSTYLPRIMTQSTSVPLVSYSHCFPTESIESFLAVAREWKTTFEGV